MNTFPEYQTFYESLLGVQLYISFQFPITPSSIQHRIFGNYCRIINIWVGQEEIRTPNHITSKIFTAVYPFHVMWYSNLIKSTRSIRMDLQLRISSLQLQSYSIFPFPLKGDFTVCLLTDIWSGWQDSNLRPRHPKCRILPTVLHPEILSQNLELITRKKIIDNLRHKDIYELFYWNKVERLIALPLFCGPGRTWTDNLWLMRPLLQPIKLQVQNIFKNNYWY